MSWILDGKTPVKVEVRGDYVYLDGDLYPDQNATIYPSRQAAREARERPVSIDRQLEHLAQVMGTEQMGFDDIFVPLLARAEELAVADKVMAKLASLLDCSVADVYEEVAEYVAGRRSQSERVDALTKEVARLHEDLRSEVAGRRADALAAEGLAEQLSRARMEVWALELKAEALHCHQVMLAAERQRLRVALEEKS